MRWSASSSARILKGASPAGIALAKVLIWFLTTSIPLSSLAFSSMKFRSKVSPKRSLAIAIAAVVLLVPGGPANRQWGTLLFSTNLVKPSMIDSCPTIPPRVGGRYFSVQSSKSIRIFHPISYAWSLCVPQVIRDTFLVPLIDSPEHSPLHTRIDPCKHIHFGSSENHGSQPRHQ